MKRLLERAACFAAAPIAIHRIDNGSERVCVASVGGCEACRHVNGRRKGQRACAKDREDAAATALSGNLIAPLFCHMGFVCVTAPLFAEGASGFALTCGPYCPAEASQSLPQEALTGWRAIDARAAALPFALDDVHVAPAPTIPAIVEWVSQELLDRFETLDTPTALSVVPEPEEAGATRRTRARGPAFDPYQARPIAAALAGGNVTQARRLVKSALEETVAGKRAEGGVRGARAVALVAAALEAAERASIDTQACWERYGDFVVEARTAETEKGHVDAAMRLLRVLKREADSDAQVSLDYKELNAIVIPRLVEGITLTEVSKLLDVKPSTLTRRLERGVGLNFTQYVSRLRLDRAKTLLRRRRMSVAEVAKRVGVSDPSYLAKLFKRFEGMSPLEYRKRFGSKS
ncbi:MAG: helix-turn-helix domain-containing protein [Nitrospiraceae bacterium]|nr:helix-turn-helix domain-containing protein [Nitrospiraceae bacterium]